MTAADLLQAARQGSPGRRFAASADGNALGEWVITGPGAPRGDGAEKDPMAPEGGTMYVKCWSCGRQTWVDDPGPRACRVDSGCSCGRDFELELEDGLVVCSVGCSVVPDGQVRRDLAGDHVAPSSGEA